MIQHKSRIQYGYFSAHVFRSLYNKSGNTLVFYTAIVAGETYDDGMIESATTAQFAMDNQFDLSKPPSRPNLSSTEGDFKVTLYWDDSSEESL